MHRFGRLPKFAEPEPERRIQPAAPRCSMWKLCGKRGGAPDRHSLFQTFPVPRRRYDQRKHAQGKEQVSDPVSRMPRGVQPDWAPAETHGERKDAVHHHENRERDGDAAGSKHQALSLSLSLSLSLFLESVRDSPLRNSRRLASTTWRSSSSNCASRSVTISTRYESGSDEAGLASIHCRNASPAT